MGAAAFKVAIPIQRTISGKLEYSQRPAESGKHEGFGDAAGAIQPNCIIAKRSIAPPGSFNEKEILRWSLGLRE